MQHTEPHFSQPPEALLASLGVHMSPTHSLLLLATLAAERPVLLVGDPGQAKTSLVRALGAALAPGRTRILNAALTSFDDVRGFIRPSSLEAGQPEIIPGPWSPYRDHLLFVDELSRAPTHQQSRWLQLLHERLVDGQPTDLRWVLAAMNPPSVDGTFPLGLATADRFLAIIALEDFGDLDPAVRLRITLSDLGPSLAPDALPRWLEAVRRRHDAHRKNPLLRLSLAKVANAMVDGFRASDPPFRPQGRRAVALFDLLAWVLAALEVERGPEEGLLALGDHLDAILVAGLVELGQVCDCDPNKLRIARDAAWKAASRAFDDLTAGTNREALAMAALVENSAEEVLERLVQAEFKRPSLKPELLTRLVTTWSERLAARHLVSTPPTPPSRTAPV
jgi:MoxR-like ATPase